MNENWLLWSVCVLITNTTLWDLGEFVPSPPAPAPTMQQNQLSDSTTYHKNENYYPQKICLIWFSYFSKADKNFRKILVPSLSAG